MRDPHLRFLVRVNKSGTWQVQTDWIDDDEVSVARGMLDAEDASRAISEVLRELELRIMKGESRG